MDPVKLRWRRIRFKVCCIRAFALYGIKKVKDQEVEGLSQRLLQPTPDTVVLDVIPDCIRLPDLARRRNIQQLHHLGGVGGVASAVKTDTDKGIQGDDADLARRRREFGANRIHKPPKRLQDLLAAAKDPTLILLLVCGIPALAFGIKHHGKEGLSDGLIVCLAVLVVSSITAISNHWPKIQLFRLSKARDEFKISVLRNSKTLSISAFDVVVGDVVLLNTGDQVPADGLWINGDALQVDESSLRERTVSDSVAAVDSSQNPFLLSGTQVISGSASMLVTAVGSNTEWGESHQSDYQSTPLQKRLHELSKHIGLIGLAFAVAVLVVLLIRYFTGNLADDDGKPHFVLGKTRSREVVDDVIGILATPFAIASSAVPEALLSAVLISIAISTTRITALKAQVRNTSACEVIGDATVICTDEKGKLTLDRLEVKKFCSGDNLIMGNPSSLIHPNVRKLLFQAVLSSQREQSSSASPSCSLELDSQIEKAIREWGVRLDEDTAQLRANHEHYQKGEADDILESCSHYYDENQNIKDVPNSFRETMGRRIQEMKSKGYKCMAFAHENLSEEPENEEGNSGEHKEERLIFIGVVGLTYPCPDKLKKEVEDLKQAGFDIKILTRNDPPTAIATATECGILDDNWDMNTGEVVEGHQFESYGENKKLEECSRIRVMARASTLNKISMVQSLKKKGEVVAVTVAAGDTTTGDASFLREVDLGFSFGSHGTQPATANSNVIILEEGFDSLAGVLTWGRAMRHNIQLFAQFQLTVSIASLVIDSVTAASAKEPPTFKIVTAISSGKVPFATLQVLWVKLIVGILAAVAITVEEPGELRKLPNFRPDQPFITITMYKNIALNALYPIGILLFIHFRGESSPFNLDSRAKDTTIFNIFVLWQLYVMMNTKGMILVRAWRRRKLFWGIIGLIIPLQVVILELLHQFADTKPLTGKQWIVCVVIFQLDGSLKRLGVPQGLASDILIMTNQKLDVDDDAPFVWQEMSSHQKCT